MKLVSAASAFGKQESESKVIPRTSQMELHEITELCYLGKFFINSALRAS